MGKKKKRKNGAKAALTLGATVLKRLGAPQRQQQPSSLAGTNCCSAAASSQRGFGALSSHTRVTQVVLSSVFFVFGLPPQPPDTHSQTHSLGEKATNQNSEAAAKKGRGRCSSIIPPQRLTHPLASRLAHTRTHTYNT